MGSPWQLSIHEEPFAWNMMQLTIVMTEKGGVFCADLCADLHLVKGGGLKHRWGEHSHVLQRFAGSGN